MDPVAARHPESDDPSDTDLPPAASPGPAVPGAPPAPPATRHRTPLLGISIALVAILAGSGLFLSGYSLGRQAASEPGTAPSDEAAFQPFWDTYHTISDRYAGGEIDRGGLVQGAIKGMIDSLGDPFSQYLSADQYQQNLQTISGQFEGIGADLGSQATDGTQGCDPLGTACRLLVTKSFDGSPAARAGLIPGDIVLSVDGTSLDGLTVDAARTMIRGPKGSMVTLGVQRGSATPGAFVITRDVDPDDRGQQPEPRRRDCRLRVGRRLLGRRRRRGRGGPDPARRSRAEEAHPRPAREPWRLRDGGAQDRQPVHRVRRGLLGAGRGRQPGRHRRALRRGRHRPRDPARRADRRRERVGQRDRRGRPAGHRARDAHRRSSRMARGPSSSGSSSPAMAARSG